jgi:hypothetical protein
MVQRQHNQPLEGRPRFTVVNCFTLFALVPNVIPRFTVWRRRRIRVRQLSLAII